MAYFLEKATSFSPIFLFFFFFFCISDIAFVFSETVPPVLLPQLSGPAAALLSLTLMRTVGTTVLHRWLSPLLLPLTLGSAWYSSKKVEQAQEHNRGQGVTVNKSFQKAWEYQKRSVIDRVTYTAISSGYSERSTVWTSSEWYKPRSSGNCTTTRCPMSYKRQSTAQSVISLIPKVWDFQSGILTPQVELNHPRQGMLGQALSISCSQPILQH